MSDSNTPETIRTFGGKKYSSSTGLGMGPAPVAPELHTIGVPEFFPNDRVGNAALNAMIEPSQFEQVVYDLDGVENIQLGSYEEKGGAKEEEDSPPPPVSGRIPRDIFEGDWVDREEEDFGRFGEKFDEAFMDYLDEPSIYTIAWAARLDFRKPKSWPTLILVTMCFMCQVFIPVGVIAISYEGRVLTFNAVCPGAYTSVFDEVDDDARLAVDGTLSGMLLLRKELTPTSPPVPAPAPQPGRRLRGGDNLASEASDPG